MINFSDRRQAMTVRTGRPSALTEAVQQDILRYATQGSFLAPVCRAAGITPQTLWNWQRRLDEGDPAAEAYADFFDSLARACARAEIDALALAFRGAAGWQGAAWWLARRYPKRWSEKSRAAAAQPAL